MSIKKISDLDSYLSAGIEPSGNQEKFVLDTFKQSLFEISKIKDTTTDQKLYSSRNFSGEDMINAMKNGLSNFFLSIDEISGFIKKLQLIMNCFDTDPNIDYITSFYLDDRAYLSCDNIIQGTAAQALWS